MGAFFYLELETKKFKNLHGNKQSKNIIMGGKKYITLIKKEPSLRMAYLFGREDRIRTCDPLVPNQMRYRPALLP